MCLNQLNIFHGISSSTNAWLKEIIDELLNVMNAIKFNIYNGLLRNMKVHMFSLLRSVFTLMVHIKSYMTRSLIII